MPQKNLRELQVGRNVGAAIGALVFLVAGIVPGFYVGSSATLILLSKLAGGPVEAGILVRTVLVLGTVAGIFYIASMFIVTGAVIGYSLGYVIYFFSLFMGYHDQQQETLHIRTRKTITGQRLSEIAKHLSFLNEQRKNIRSIVLVGSTAYDANSHDSDIDIVLICNERDPEAVQSCVCEREINDSLKNIRDVPIEYTVLHTAHIQELLTLASPLIYSVIHGAVIADDGYLSNLKAQAFEALPGRSYFRKCLKENILVQYFGSLHALRRDIRKHRCSDLCCSTTRHCAGLASGNILAKTIMRMLYLTLPAKGYIPLTKSDVIDFTRTIYGEENAYVAERAAQITRNDSGPVLFSDYLHLKPFATRLCHESIATAGIGKDTIRMLRDVSSLVRGDHSKIQDEKLRACVL